MITTYGAMPSKMPDGFFKAVRFPVLNVLNSRTGDGRRIDAAGYSSRELPLSIRAQFKAEGAGHMGAEITGALFEVTVDSESGIASGRGFLLNDMAGRRHAQCIATGAMRGNSVDLADVEVVWGYDMQTDLETIVFKKCKLAATTGVATPAFAEAYAEMDDEITASMMLNPMEELVASCDEHTINIVVQDELIASATATGQIAADRFFVPEANVPTKITVDEHGHVYGHLGLWQSCHDGIEGTCVAIPRPVDNYASFNKPGVLTDRGIIETGPIFAFGGHRPSKSAPTIEDAYGGIENAWSDVRVIEGKHGPWLSGIVRPGTDDATVYAARASRISGHWVGGKLKAIVSVNAEGYDVPGSGMSIPTFAFRTDDAGIAELVASFPPCLTVDEFVPITVDIEVEVEVKVGDGGMEDDMEDCCPPATQDVATNLENRQSAIDTAAYGPLNPADANPDFWQAKADRWSVTIDQAQGSLCGNCAAFIQTEAMLGCIESGLGDEPGNASAEVMDAANLGYCEIFDFKCAGTRTCDAWVVGGPITDANASAVVGEDGMAAQMLAMLLADE